MTLNVHDFTFSIIPALLPKVLTIKFCRIYIKILACAMYEVILLLLQEALLGKCIAQTLKYLHVLRAMFSWCCAETGVFMRNTGNRLFVSRSTQTHKAQLLHLARRLFRLKR